MPPRARPLPPSVGECFSVGAARDAGISERRLRHRDLTAPFHGVRVRADALAEALAIAQADVERDVSSFTIAARFHRTTLLLRARACAQVAPTHSFFRSVTAGVIWGVPLPLRCVNPDAHARLVRRHDTWDATGELERDSPRPLDLGVLAPHRASRAAGVRGRQLSPVITTVHVRDGLPVVGAATLWAQLGEELTVDELIAVGDALVREPRDRAGRRQTPGSGHTTIAALDAALTAGRRTGAAKLREALTHVRVGSASVAETDLRLALARAGLPEPTLDFEVIDPRGGLIGITEIAYPEHRILAEYEGDHHRVDRAQWERDIRKHADAAAAGWTVLRLTSRHLYPRPDAAVRHVRDALRRAGWRP